MNRNGAKIKNKMQAATGVDSLLNNGLRHRKQNYRAQHEHSSAAEIVWFEGEKAARKYKMASDRSSTSMCAKQTPGVNEGGRYLANCTASSSANTTT